MIPVEGVKPVSIEKALQDEPRLKEEAKAEEVVDRLLTYGQQVEGCCEMHQPTRRVL